LQTKMFDMATDGTGFALVIPPKSEIYKGLNASKGTSPIWYENLRPGFLFDSMLVRGLEMDDLYSVISETTTEEDKASKRLMTQPEYILNVVRRKPNSQELYPVRVVHIHRADLLPYEQDLYDDQGNMETQIFYSAWQDYGGTKYPSAITLKRPLGDYPFELKVTVERISPNTPLTNDQFQEELPEGYKTIELK
jgi:hypothetical protein